MFGPLAQLVERFDGIEEVVGSSPIRSTRERWQSQSNTPVLFPICLKIQAHLEFRVQIAIPLKAEGWQSPVECAALEMR